MGEHPHNPLMEGLLSQCWQNNSCTCYPAAQLWQRGLPMTITYTLLQIIDYIPRHLILAELRAAFDLWAQLIPVTFQETQAYKEADIIIEFISTQCYQLALCTISKPYEPRRVRFNAMYHWRLKPCKEELPSIYGTAVHEIGHTLGLQHSSHPWSYMYPNAKNDHQKYITASDAFSIQALYENRITHEGTNDLPTIFCPQYCVYLGGGNYIRE